MKAFVFPFDSDNNIIKVFSSWKCFKDFDYVFINLQEKAFPDERIYKELIFGNLKINRKIKISLYCGINTIIIKNVDNYKGKFVNGSFSVEDWLRYNKKSISEQFNHSEYFEICKNSHKEGIKPLFNFLEPLFRGPLKPVLIGERWDNIPRDVLFGDYD